MRNFCAAAVQFAPESLQVERNLERMVGCIAEAAQQGAQLVVFPELANTGYIRWPSRRTELNLVEQLAKVTRPIPGRDVQTLAEAAKKHGVYVVSGLAEADQRVAGRYFNAAVLIGPDGKLIGHHRKVTTPMAEVFYFIKGQELEVFETDLGRIGLMICYDTLFPEPARVLTLKGMEILCISWAAAHPNPPTISPELNVPTGFMARTIVEAPLIRAMENVIFVVSASRVGNDSFSGGRFLGNSIIAAPWGDTLAEAGLDDEKIITAELQGDLLPLIRGSRPMLKDRRPELYSILSEMP